MGETSDDQIDTTERGKIVWASSDEGSGPDVGISIGLGGGREIWIGEISRDLHANGGAEVAEVGNDFGRWIVLYDSTKPRAEQATIIGKAVGSHVASEFCEELQQALTTTEQQR